MKVMKPKTMQSSSLISRTTSMVPRLNTVDDDDEEEMSTTTAIAIRKEVK